MDCNLVIQNNNQLNFKNLQKYKKSKKYLTYYDLREEGDVGVEGNKIYNFFEKDFYLDCLQESIKKVIKDCKYLIDTYNLKGENKSNFEKQLGTKGSGDGRYQITQKKLRDLGIIYQKLLQQSKEPLKTKSLPIDLNQKKNPVIPVRSTKSLPLKTGLKSSFRGGFKNKKTRKFKKLPRVNSPKKINKNTNLNYTL